MYNLIPVTERHAEFLYDMLFERDNVCAISFHMPTWEEHKAFINSNPYACWYIIERDGDFVGNTYKTIRGEIGIFVLKRYQGQGIAKEVIPMMYDKGPERNLANINPNNAKSIRLFEKLGFTLIQNTYELKEA